MQLSRPAQVLRPTVKPIQKVTSQCGRLDVESDSCACNPLTESASCATEAQLQQAAQYFLSSSDDDDGSEGAERPDRNNNAADARPSKTEKSRKRKDRKYELSTPNTHRSAIKAFHCRVDGIRPTDDTSVGTGERGMPSCPRQRQRRLLGLRKERLRRGSSQGASSRASGWQAMPPLGST